MVKHFAIILVIFLMCTSCTRGTEEVEVPNIPENKKHDIVIEAIKDEVEVHSSDESNQEESDNKNGSDTEFKSPIDVLNTPTILPISVVLTPGEDIINSCHITIRVASKYDNLMLVLIDHIEGRVIEIQASFIIETGDGEEELSYKSFSYMLTGLKNQRTYDYYFVEGEDNSAPMKFTLPGSNQTTRLLVYGDLQGYLAEQYEWFSQNLNQQVTPTVDMVLLLGDLVDVGSSAEQWSYFYDAVNGIGSAVLFSTTIGNHDAYDTRDLYNQTFRYSENGISQNTYFYDLPFARVIVLDTESPSLFDEQAEWLMKISSETKQPYKIVMMHRGVYPVFYDEPYIQNWAPIFQDAQIDLVLNGHDHIYSRTTMYENQQSTDQGAVTYIGAGSGSGSKFYEAFEERAWLDVVYDENEPVWILLDVGMEQMKMRAYVGTEEEYQIIDEWILK